MAALALAVLAMALGAQLDVPMHPVPMSLQSLAVLGAGAFLGPVWGTVAVLVYLAAGAFGLPVFAGGASGWARFLGPTGGYLAAFPIACAIVGWTAVRGWMRRPTTAVVIAFAGHAVLLAVGVFWLGRSVGMDAAINQGAAPFLIGAVVKSAVLALAVTFASRQRSFVRGG